MVAFGTYMEALCQYFTYFWGIFSGGSQCEAALTDLKGDGLHGWSREVTIHEEAPELEAKLPFCSPKAPKVCKSNSPFGHLQWAFVLHTFVV